MTQSGPRHAAAVEATSRVAARVLLIDGNDRVLMLRGFDPARPDHRYWMTVGGGLDPGETSIDAAVRELAEETGLRLTADDLTGPVHRETVRFPFDGHWYDQEQDYFVARVESFDVDVTGFSEIEIATIDAHQWWSADELDATDERFYPPDLAGLLRSTAACQVPAASPFLPPVADVSRPPEVSDGGR